MINVLRKITFLIALLILGCSIGAAPAFAKTHHKKHHVVHKKSKVSHSKVSAAEKRRVMTAQQHLISLGYLDGKADGIAGPKTKIALEHFQRDHKLPITGKLTTATYNALVEMDMEKTAPNPTLTGPGSANPPQPDFYATHPDFYGHVNPQYADPMVNSTAVNGDNGQTTARTQTLPNRFAKLDVAENVQGTFKSYTVTMNGQPLLQSADQPAVIGISRTYNLGDEDAIIFSTYRSFDPLCSYKTYLLTLSSGANNVQEVNNCTRGYQASVKEGSLYITFPEYDDKRAVGNTWRYEKGTLNKL